MKTIKKTTENLPENQSISITAHFFWSDWSEAYLVRVEANLYSNFTILKSFSYSVGKPKPVKFLWFTIKEAKSWKQAVLDKAAELESELRDWLYVNQKDQAVNDGLLDSLDKL